VRLQVGSGAWELAANGADPRQFGTHPYGLSQGLTLANQGAFFIGGYNGVAAGKSIRYFDFAAQRVTKVMGGSVSGFSPDSAVPGSVQDLDLHGFCHDQRPCHVLYQPDEDRLYFSEFDRIRYITAPTDPAVSTLTTLFTASLVVGGFILSLDGTQLFYLMEDGRLYCHDRGSGAAWCNDTALGPPSGMAPAANAPNQLAWMDAANLLVNTSRGEIYLYRLGP
jgi:hypothetical protein